MGFDLAGDHVARDDAPRFAVLDDELHHLVPAVALDRPGRDLALKRLIGADEQLLARLAAGVEGAGDLHAAEGAVVQVSAVLPGEGDPLCHALVDDVGADLGQAVDVGLPGAEVAALDRVVEEPVSRIVVVLVVLRRVDAALSGDRVGAARGVLVEERLDVVPHLAQGSGRRPSREAGADDDDGQLAAVGRVDEPGLELALLPLAFQRACGGLGVGDLHAFGVENLSHVPVPLRDESKRDGVRWRQEADEEREAAQGREAPEEGLGACAGGPQRRQR